MKNKLTMKIIGTIAVLGALLFNACSSLKEFGTTPDYRGTNRFEYHKPAYDSNKKTVVIVANNDGTELFDMMAPYYLFSATGKANVYIVAKNKFPIEVKKGLFVLPQSTFSEIDSLKIKPDVIVIPFLSIADSIHQDPDIVNWIKKKYVADVNILSICDGSATAAATGIFDGKPITAHASDWKRIKANFSKPMWVQHISVVNSGNLYSSAGVSNATEGSLIVIQKLFGTEIMKKVIEEINYPSLFPKTEHQSKTFRFRDKVAIGKKIIFRKDKKMGVFLQSGIDEFRLAAVMDTYNRTFPKTIESFSENNLPIKTKYGLTLIPTGNITESKIDELHVLIEPNLLQEPGTKSLEPGKIVMYDRLKNQYVIETCLQRIKLEYGSKFANAVKLMLDYN